MVTVILEKCELYGIKCEVVQTRPLNGSRVSCLKLLLFAVTAGSGFPGKYVGLNIIATVKST